MIIDTNFLKAFGTGGPTLPPVFFAVRDSAFLSRDRECPGGSGTRTRDADAAFLCFSQAALGAVRFADELEQRPGADADPATVQATRRAAWAAKAAWWSARGEEGQPRRDPARFAAAIQAAVVAGGQVGGGKWLSCGSVALPLGVQAALVVAHRPHIFWDGPGSLVSSPSRSIIQHIGANR